jgi:NAD+ dependent glucose-6-phosphate dehydrogenase
MTERSILLTGSEGRIGSAFFTEAAGRYRFLLADLRVLDDPPHGEHEWIALDVADLDACRAACAGIDTVIHLAADPDPEADFYASLLESNIQGAYNILRAAADNRCRRVILASSLHVVAGYPTGGPVAVDAPPRPVTMYGASKAFAEAAGYGVARTEGMSVIAIRIGAYEAPWIAEDPTPANLSAFVSARDMNQLLIRCVETAEIPFAIVAGISDNRTRRIDLESTRRLLDYHPQDDGFALFQSPPLFDL